MEDSTSKFVFEIKSDPRNLSRKPTPIYPLNYGSVYMAQLSEGFDMTSRINLGRIKNVATKIFQYLGIQEKIDFCHFFPQNPKLLGTRHSNSEDPDNCSNLDHEKGLGKKSDYLFFQSLRLLQTTEVQLLKNQG